jgi:ubiquinone/menaquinone biosynthesis C-methylase UbiE
MNQSVGTIGGLARAATLCLLTAGPAAWAQQPGAGADAPNAGRPKAEAKQAESKSAKARRDRPGFYMGRRIADVMSWQGAEWLFRETRIDEEQPEAMLDALEIAPGSTVADVGTGAGYHSIRLARRVGAGGVVLATDVQPEMLTMLKENAKAAGVDNIRPLLATQRDTKLPAGKVDLILMVDVYHECSQPDVLLAGLHKALRPGGRLVLVEFRGEDPEVPIKPEHKMTLKQVRREVEAAGFRFQKSHEFLPWQHVIVFEKPKPEPTEEAEAEKPKAATKPAPDPAKS